MLRRPNTAPPPEARAAAQTLVCLLFIACGFTSCKKSGQSVAPRFRKIDAMLGARLPRGSTRSRVIYFLSSRGYSMTDGPDQSTVIATVQLVDLDSLQPVVARVTFHFDSNDKLTFYQLQPGPEAPLRPQ